MRRLANSAGLSVALFISRLILVMGLLQISSANAAIINDVRIWHAPDHSRIVFDMDKRSTFKVFSLDNPGRVVIDLNGASLQSAIPKTSSTGQFISKIRLGVPEEGAVRLVFDLKVPVRYFVRMLKPSGKYAYRLVVDFYHQSYDPDANAPAKTIAKPDSSVSRKQGLLIAIDPGHGGEDPGARGKRSFEKDVVLEISRRLKRMIDKTPGMHAKLTRNGDYYVELRRRSALARREGADLFISIHADAFSKPTARGASVYALSLRGATSETARILASKENLSDLAGGVNLADKDSSVAEVLLDLSMSYTINESIRFGNEVLTELKKIGRVHSKKVEQAGFVVLKSPDVPSILVETAYITNPTEEKLLRSKRHQEKIARAILVGVQRYVARNPNILQKKG